jgi:hypothetical protein
MQPLRTRGPTPEQAFEAFRTLMAFCIEQRGAADSVYDQRPDRLPPDAKSADAYRRWHRTARRAGVPGVWSRGKLLLATPEAWTTSLPREPRSRNVTLPANDDEALDAALGIRAVRRGR